MKFWEARLEKMKYNPLDGERARIYYDNLPENQKEGVMGLGEALKIKKKIKKWKCPYCKKYIRLGDEHYCHG